MMMEMDVQHSDADLMREDMRLVSIMASSLKDHSSVFFVKISSVLIQFYTHSLVCLIEIVESRIFKI